MAKSSIYVAQAINSAQEMHASTVTELAQMIGTSRTNVSDCVNEREGRETVTGKDGTVWAVA